MKKLLLISLFLMLFGLVSAFAQPWDIPPWRPQQPGCPGGAICHPGGIPIAFMGNDQADMVGQEIQEYKCSLLDPYTCIIKVLVDINFNCWGPKGPIRQELCDNASPEAGVERAYLISEAEVKAFLLTELHNAKLDSAPLLSYQNDDVQITVIVQGFYSHPGGGKEDFVLHVFVESAELNRKSSHLIIGEKSGVIVFASMAK